MHAVAKHTRLAHSCHIGTKSQCNPAASLRAWHACRVAHTMVSKDHLLGVFYVLLNTVSGCGVVFANKLVLTTFSFQFVYALMFIHTLTSLVGLTLLSMTGLFERKCAPPFKILPLAAAFVGCAWKTVWDTLSASLGSCMLELLMLPCIRSRENLHIVRQPTSMLEASG